MATTLVNSGASDWRTEDIDSDEMVLNMGPQHPSTHGVLRPHVDDHLVGV